MYQVPGMECQESGQVEAITDPIFWPLFMKGFRKSVHGKKHKEKSQGHISIKRRSWILRIFLQISDGPWD